MNQLMPWDGEVARMGWPWHGKIRQPDKDLAGYVTLPNGATRPAIAHYGTWPMNHTHLFDMGLPDQDDPQVEEQGGKWWGRTILRGGGNYDYQLYYGGATTSAEGQSYTGEAPFRGLPLWWDSDEEPRRPLYVDIYLNLEQGSYYLDFWTKGGTIHTLRKKITLEDVGQGAGQPECAVKDLLGSNFDYWFFGDNVKLDYLKLLGVYRNRLLLGVVVTQGEGMRQIDPPPGTSVVSGSSPSGAPQGLYGLVEVTIAPDIRDPEADHSQTVTIDVIENRQAALGNPVHQVTDESSQPGDPIETTLYLEEWNQTSGLLTAWYDAQGNIETARYNRRHYALKEYRNEPGVTTRTATERTSEVALLSGSGSVVDSSVLTEQFEAIYIPGTGLQITRTVKCTGSRMTSRLIPTQTIRVVQWLPRRRRHSPRYAYRQHRCDLPVAGERREHAGQSGPASGVACRVEQQQRSHLPHPRPVRLSRGADHNDRQRSPGAGRTPWRRDLWSGYRHPDKEQAST